MATFRYYGDEPFNLIVLHGGPGVAGTMASVAKELGKKCGVIEPMVLAETITEQLKECTEALLLATKPAVLIGHSWGAWLGFLLAAQHSQGIQKLILIGCGSFVEEHVATMNMIRESRLSQSDQKRLEELKSLLNHGHADEKAEAFLELGRIMDGVDSYSLLPTKEEDVLVRPQIFSGLMKEINTLRSEGSLLSIAKEIQCPVVAIHGRHDPHLPVGVRDPLKEHVKDFRFILLDNCGHTPWRERYARDHFFSCLEEEIANA